MVDTFDGAPVGTVTVDVGWLPPTGAEPPARAPDVEPPGAVPPVAPPTEEPAEVGTDNVSFPETAAVGAEVVDTVVPHPAVSAATPAAIAMRVARGPILRTLEVGFPLSQRRFA